MNGAGWPIWYRRGRRLWWQTRRCVPTLRSAIERLAAESRDVASYDAAAAAFLMQFEISGPKHLGRPALDRLLRFYIRHFRRELIEENRYIEAAARRALMGAASPGGTA
jgi:hypothetical protein